MNFSDYLLKGKKNLDKRIFFHNELTYSKLYSLVNESYFENHLDIKNCLIGICINDPAKFITAYLSIIKDNNIAIILEKGLPAPRYLELLNKFKINFFITDDITVTNELENNKDYILKNDKFSFFKLNLFSKKKSEIKKRYKYNAVSTVLFTSGTTGEKKGVMLTHKNLISNTSAILKILPIKKNDIVNLLLPTSYSFGLSVLLTHLKAGSKFFFHDSPFVGSIIQELKKYRCTSFYGVPSTFEILLNKTNFLKNKFSKLRFFAQAGGKLEKKYKYKLIDKFKNKFYVMYGSTEASPRLSIINPKDLKNKIESIGQPLPGVVFKLFKYKNTKSFQLGVKGKNIMKGYLMDKKLTKNSFKNNFYLTGDIVWKDEQNFYYITGRIDKIIKRFGFKINIEQIKKVIKKIEYVEDFKLDFKNENFYLRIVLKANFKNKIKDFMIKKKLRENLTSYEIPDKIFFVSKIVKYYNKKN